MAKKLVFDRSLSLCGMPHTSITVPDDEVWKACTSESGSDSKPTAYLYDGSFSSYDRIIGGGTEIRSINRSSTITGIVFKVVEQ